MDVGWMVVTEQVDRSLSLFLQTSQPASQLIWFGTNQSTMRLGLFMTTMKERKNFFPQSGLQTVFRFPENSAASQHDRVTIGANSDAKVSRLWL